MTSNSTSNSNSPHSQIIFQDFATQSASYVATRGKPNSYKLSSNPHVAPPAGPTNTISNTQLHSITNKSTLTPAQGPTSLKRRVETLGTKSPKKVSFVKSNNKQYQIAYGEDPDDPIESSSDEEQTHSDSSNYFNSKKLKSSRYPHTACSTDPAHITSNTQLHSITNKNTLTPAQGSTSPKRRVETLGTRSPKKVSFAKSNNKQYQIAYGEDPDDPIESSSDDEQTVMKRLDILRTKNFENVSITKSNGKQRHIAYGEDPDDPIESSSDDEQAHNGLKKNSIKVLPPKELSTNGNPNSFNAFSQHIKDPLISIFTNPRPKFIEPPVIIQSYPEIINEPKYPKPLMKLLIKTVRNIQHGKHMIAHYKMTGELDKYSCKWADFHITKVSPLPNGWLCTGELTDLNGMHPERAFNAPIQLILYSNKRVEKLEADAIVSCYDELYSNDHKTLFFTHNWAILTNNGSSILNTKI